MGYGLYCWVYHVKEASLTPRWWAQGCGSPGPSSWKKHHLTGPAKTRKTRGFDLSRSTNWFHFNSSRQTQKSCGLHCIALPESLDCIYAISPQPRFWSPLFHWRFDLLVVPRYHVHLGQPVRGDFPSLQPIRAESEYLPHHEPSAMRGCRAGVQVCLWGRTDVRMPNCPLLHNFASIPIFF